jgi:hypothetical protein
MVVELAEGVSLTALVPNVDEVQRQRLPGAGARVRLTWSPEHMHVLPAQQPPASSEAVPAVEQKQGAFTASA